jgi:hypothetical protein
MGKRLRWYLDGQNLTGACDARRANQQRHKECSAIQKTLDMRRNASVTHFEASP